MKTTTSNNTLPFCGRESHHARLQAHLPSPTSPLTWMTLHGPSGMGKTRLGRRLPEVWAGKFEQLHVVTTPYSAIAQALQASLECDPEILRQALQDEGKMVAYLVPALKVYLTNSTTTEEENENSTHAQSDTVETPTSNDNNVGELDPKQPIPRDDSSRTTASTGEMEGTGQLASERLALAMESFLKRLQRPITLFLDDVQWADPSSMELLQAFLRPNPTLPVLVILAYRDEHFSPPTFELEPVVDLVLEGLDLEATNQLLNFSLEQRLPRKANHVETDTLPLAHWLRQKTYGNPQLISECLQKWLRVKFIWYSDNQWQWDLEGIQAEPVEAVVDLVSQRIQTLPPPLLNGVRIAAYLEFQVDRRLWLHLYENHGNELFCNHDKWDFDLLVQAAVEENLMLPCETMETLKFSHDKIQQAIYDLPSHSKQDQNDNDDWRAQMHMRLGKALEEIFHLESHQARLLILAADQWNRAFRVLNDEQRRHLIRLNFEAGKIAKKEMGFGLYTDLLWKAIEISKDDDWNQCYEIMVEIYSQSAEAQLTRGDLEWMQHCVDELLKKARTNRHKALAHMTVMKMHGATRQFAKAIETGRLALKLLGETLPKATTMTVTVEVLKTKRLLWRKQDAYLLNIARNKEESFLRIMEIIHLVAIYGWNSDPNYSALCFSRAMRLTLLRGRCMYTCWAFAAFGLVLASLGEEQEAYRFSKLAMEYSKGSMSTYSSICLYINVFLAHLRRPVENGLDPLLSGYRVGLQTGEMFFASIDLCAYADLYMFCGLPLQTFTRDISKFGAQLKICHQDLALSFILPWYQLALNLSGRTSDCVAVSWEACRQHDIFTESVTLDDASPPGLYLNYVQILNAYVLGEWDVAEASFTRLLALKTRRLFATHFANVLFVFLDGLLCYGLLQQKPNRNYATIGKQSLRELRRIAKRRKGNHLGLLYLLEAEEALSRGKLSLAEQQYKSAISVLARSGTTHFSAIANERAGLLSLSRKDKYWARHYIAIAVDLYRQWGATVKADMLTSKTLSKLISDLEGKDDDESAPSSFQNISIRGRIRFDPALDTMEMAESQPFSEKRVAVK